MTREYPRCLRCGCVLPRHLSICPERPAGLGIPETYREPWLVRLLDRFFRLKVRPW